MQHVKHHHSHDSCVYMPSECSMLLVLIMLVEYFL